MILGILRLSLFADLISTTMDTTDGSNPFHSEMSWSVNEDMSHIISVTEESDHATQNLGTDLALSDEGSNNEIFELEEFFSRSYSGAKRELENIIESNDKKFYLLNFMDSIRNSSSVWDTWFSPEEIELVTELFSNLVASIWRNSISNVGTSGLDLNRSFICGLCRSTGIFTILKLFDSHVSLIDGIVKDENKIGANNNPGINMEMFKREMADFISDMKYYHHDLIFVAENIRYLFTILHDSGVDFKTVRKDPKMIEKYNESVFSKTISGYKKFIEKAKRKINKKARKFIKILNENNHGPIWDLICRCQCLYSCLKTIESHLELLERFFNSNTNDSISTSLLDESLQKVLVSSLVIIFSSLDL